MPIYLAQMRVCDVYTCGETRVYRKSSYPDACARGEMRCDGGGGGSLMLRAWIGGWGRVCSIGWYLLINWW